MSEQKVDTTPVKSVIPPSDGTEKKTAKTTPVSRRSEQAGLNMPVGRIARLMKETKKVKHISAKAAVYMTGVMEACAEAVWTGAAAKVKENKKSRIKPKYIMAATKADSDLGQLTLGGFMPKMEVQPENVLRKEVVDAVAKKNREAAKREKKKVSHSAALIIKAEKLEEQKRLAASAKRRLKRIEKKRQEARKPAVVSESDSSENESDSSESDSSESESAKDVEPEISAPQKKRAPKKQAAAAAQPVKKAKKVE